MTFGNKRSLLVIWVCLGASLSTGAADSRETRGAALKETFRYQPAPATDAPPSESEDGVVVLEKLTVTDSSQRTLAAQMAAKSAEQAKERFAWNKGGLLLRSDRVDLGAWITLEDSVAGAVPTRDVKVKIELLRIRW